MLDPSFAFMAKGGISRICGKGLRGQSSGILHLAKNERDVGHPGMGGEKRALMGARTEMTFTDTLGSTDTLVR